MFGSAVAGTVAECPAPVVDFGRIHTVGVGVVAVFLDLILHALLDVGRTGAEGLHAVDHVDHQVVVIDLVADGQLQGDVDVAVLLVAPNVEVGLIGTAMAVNC